jgi:hypothetical protein
MLILCFGNALCLLLDKGDESLLQGRRPPRRPGRDSDRTARVAGRRTDPRQPAGSSSTATWSGESKVRKSPWTRSCRTTITDPHSIATRGGSIPACSNIWRH